MTEDTPQSTTPPPSTTVHHHNGWFHDHPGGNVWHAHETNESQMRAHHGPNIGNSATNGLIQGFAGCLGVGIAIVMVIIVLFIFISAGSHG